MNLKKIHVLQVLFVFLMTFSILDSARGSDEFAGTVITSVPLMPVSPLCQPGEQAEKQEEGVIRKNLGAEQEVNNEESSGPGHLAFVTQLSPVDPQESSTELAGSESASQALAGSEKKQGSYRRVLHDSWDSYEINLWSETQRQFTVHKQEVAILGNVTPSICTVQHDDGGKHRSPIRKIYEILNVNTYKGYRLGEIVILKGSLADRGTAHVYTRKLKKYFFGKITKFYAGGFAQIKIEGGAQTSGYVYKTVSQLKRALPNLKGFSRGDRVRHPYAGDGTIEYLFSGRLLGFDHAWVCYDNHEWREPGSRLRSLTKI